MPVEEFKQRWGDRVAVLGGVDVDLLSRGTPERLSAPDQRRSSRLLGRRRLCLRLGQLGDQLRAGRQLPGHGRDRAPVQRPDGLKLQPNNCSDLCGCFLVERPCR